ncbi:uncharacterized protein YdhG (YjbR/CyaY superfamily) [Roseimicrobium gellanilyticum]|uniref:Uncharacterized protein YdhG (YjbR/CyaY superfamily) n=1 Tax=Roseimicrobium gellanilyticum TaxID=748857 RepID=A0A366HIQ9_9BACT|nr:DUF1801 domain-containing protein [Roseimicrobium gellanilyticum]RBP41489.1 uncharacterized protein YdhG (YjbR/CyaY superfamily) [Roseimicrobium gellanilyticum]
MPRGPKVNSIDEYIAEFSPEVQAILQEIRSTIQKAVPDAEEKISYQIPAFTLGGKVFIFFAAFKKHLGLYPPMKGDAKLEKETARYAGEKGNLQFPLSEPIPYALISRIAKFKAKEHAERTPAQRVKKTK